MSVVLSPWTEEWSSELGEEQGVHRVLLRCGDVVLGVGFGTSPEEALKKAFQYAFTLLNDMLQQMGGARKAFAKRLPPSILDPTIRQGGDHRSRAFRQKTAQSGELFKNLGARQ